MGTRPKSWTLSLVAAVVVGQGSEDARALTGIRVVQWSATSDHIRVDHVAPPDSFSTISLDFQADLTSRDVDPTDRKSVV